MNVTFCAGTAAELIKLAPLIGRSERGGADWRAVFTGQAAKSFLDQWDDFGFSRERLRSLETRAADLSSSCEAGAWFLRTAARIPFPAPALRRERQSAKGLWLVHGDTLSTFAGAMLGARLGMRVGHVEAGLRSHTVLDPFPEEVCRRMVAKVATLHYAPERPAYDNLLREKVRGEVVYTAGNTQIDAVLEVLNGAPSAPLHPTPYVLVNIHRFETMMSAERGAQVKDILRRAAKLHTLIIVSHATTLAWVAKDPEFRAELERNGAVWLPRQRFTLFVRWLVGAIGVISDSGGNQEECAMLGVPCLLLRFVTERELPAGRTNVVLSQFKEDLIAPFLRDPAAYRIPQSVSEDSPADCIFSHMSGVADQP